MVAAGTASRAEADRARAEALDLKSTAEPRLAPALVGRVVAALNALFRSDGWMGAGLRIVTTLDWTLQREAERTLRDAVAVHRADSVTDGTLVAIDPRTSDVLALVGTVRDDEAAFGLDLTAAARNPGSSFRLFTYAAAIAGRRYTAATPLADGAVRIDPDYRVVDIDPRSGGQCRLRDCLGGGLNVPAVQVELGVGIPEVVRLARAAGVRPLALRARGGLTADGSDEDYGPSLTLGGYPVTPMEMAAALATMASGGLQAPPRLIRSIRDTNGIQLPVPDQPPRRALEAATAFVVSDMLADDGSRVTDYAGRSVLALPGRRAAALAGLTDDLSDSWTLGYNPSLATMVWMGSPNPTSPSQHANQTADRIAGPPWRAFMQAALDHLGVGDDWYPPPPGVRPVPVDGRTAWLLDGTAADAPAPALPATVHVE
jgi:membrane peptidoglycan carboxypeptidase